MRYEDYLMIIDRLRISKSLNEYILNTKFQFNENEVVYLIYKYSNNYDEKIELLDEMNLKIENQEVKNKIDIAIKYLLQSKELFLNQEEDYVYDLHIQDLAYPNDNEHYLSKTFKSAMDRIDAFFKYYKDIDVKETENTRYSVTKRLIKDYTSFIDFDNDEVGECHLGPGKIVQFYDYWPLINYGSNEDGTDDNKIWEAVKSIEVEYPDFIRGYSLIKFCDYWHKDTYGLVVPLSPDSTPESELYILPISKDIYKVAQKEQTYESNVFGFHQHLEHALVEIVRIEEIDGFTKECYELLKKVVKQQLSTISDK